jgi:hypothetical protein
METGCVRLLDEGYLAPLHPREGLPAVRWGPSGPGGYAETTFDAWKAAQPALLSDLEPII